MIAPTISFTGCSGNSLVNMLVIHWSIYKVLTIAMLVIAPNKSIPIFSVKKSLPRSRRRHRSRWAPQTRPHSARRSSAALRLRRNGPGAIMDFMGFHGGFEGKSRKNMIQQVPIWFCLRTRAPKLGLLCEMKVKNTRRFAGDFFKTPSGLELVVSLEIFHISLGEPL